jgi:integrase
MGKLNDKGLKALLKKPPKRHADGDGLFFKVAGQGKAYWTFRYTLGGKESETSLGPYPELSLDAARIRHLELRAAVAKKIDPVAKRGGKIGGKAAPAGTPTFGVMADQYIAAHEGSWRSAKHARQWSSTLTVHAAAIRDLPVDQIAAEHVLEVLRPIWSTTPETASRLRARIEVVLASAQVAGHIAPDKPNPARWKGWLDHMLANPRKVGKPRRHHAAMPYADLPAFMARLAEIDSAPSKALQLTILTASRTKEVRLATFDELKPAAVWSRPEDHMKMGKAHDVPLSDQALAIVRAQKAAQEAAQDANPHIFPGRPMRPLSPMAMSMLLRRLDVPVTVHGFRSSFRDWAAEQGVAFELAEACLAHSAGSTNVTAYLRTSMLERRRPIMAKWAAYVCGEADNVVQLKQGAA